MANYAAIYSVGDSIAQALQNAYPPALNTQFPCRFQLVASSEIAVEDTTSTPLEQVVSVYLHRVTINENFRSATAVKDSPNTLPVVFLDLHYLLSYWGTGAQAEHTILGWTIQQLQSFPILDSSVLSTEGGWDPTESVQLVMADLTLEDILRIWDGLGPKYRLSVAYTARVVRIDRPITGGRPVVATRFNWQLTGEPA